MSTSGAENPGDKHAWRDLAAKGLPKRSARERVSDFLEIYGLYSEEEVREQASRCIQCPNPSCVGGCPLCNPIPQWMQLTAEGRFLEAAAVVGSATNMAEICTRLCPKERLCEDTCILGATSQPVAIGEIEQFLAEYAIAHGHLEIRTAPPNGFKVAVIGAGPGGLACADELAKKGFAVTVFDSALVPGGLLVNGTPAFRLDESIVQRRVEILKQRGVVFKLGAALWLDVTLGELRRHFDAVFLGIDSRTARQLQVPGANLEGVVQAMPFILQKATPVSLELPPLKVEGKRVVVIGGGDSAMDCLRTALRHGAREAICVYRRGESWMPCGRHAYEDTREEGAQFLFEMAPVAVIGNEAGKVKALRLGRTQAGPIGGDGRAGYSLIPGTESELETDWVISALGFDRLPCPHTGDLGELAINDWGGLIVNGNQMTNVPGVFAGGDIVRGPSTVIDIVRDARAAAAGIGTFLSARAKTPVNPGKPAE